MRKNREGKKKLRRITWINENGGKCIKCGSIENLEIDHIKPELKLIEIYALWEFNSNNKRYIDELKKCQILCRKCHRIKTSDEQRKPIIHGTQSGYNIHKCKCELCKNCERKRSRMKYLKKKEKYYVSSRS